MGFTATEGHLNRIGPLKKPYHTLMPVIVTDAKSGLWKAAMGTMGGYGQPQINLQVKLVCAHDTSDILNKEQFCASCRYCWECWSMVLTRKRQLTGRGSTSAQDTVYTPSKSGHFPHGYSLRSRPLVTRIAYVRHRCYAFAGREKLLFCRCSSTLHFS